MNYVRCLAAACFLFGLAGKAHPQATVFEKDIRLVPKLRPLVTSWFAIDRGEVLPVLSEAGAPTLLLIDKKEIVGWRVGGGTDYAAPRPPGKYSEVLGYSTDAAGHHVYFSNLNKDQFYVQTVGSKSSGREVPIRLGKERFLECFSHRDKFYLLTIAKNTSVLSLYVFEGAEPSSKSTFDLSRHSFITKTYTDLYRAVFWNMSEGYSKPERVDPGIPVSLRLSANPTKLYYSDSLLYLTLDKQQDHTKIITLNLNTREHTIEIYFHQPAAPCQNTGPVVSNSFLVGDTLFQMQACPNGLSLMAKEMTTKEQLLVYEVGKKEEITLSNGAATQRGGNATVFTSGEKALTKTSRILRRIANGHGGLTAYPSGGYFLLTVGGYVPASPGYSAPGGFVPGVPIGNGYASPAIYASPVQNSFLDILGSSARTVFFQALLAQESLQHVPGTLGKTALEKIRSFRDEMVGEVPAQTIFQHEGAYLFGYYNRAERKYVLRRFTDELR